MANFIFGNGSDTVNSGNGNDRFELNGGNDTIFAGGGNDTIFGGPGNDLAKFSGDAGDYLGSIVDGSTIVIFGPDGYDELHDVEQVQFGNDAPIPITDFVDPTNDTDYPIATVNSVVAGEGDISSTFLNFTITLSKPAVTGGASLMVNTLAIGSAVPGIDFAPIVDQVVFFGDGDTSAGFGLEVFPDSLFELNETIVVQLSQDTTPGATGQVIPSPNTGQGTVNDQDPMPTVTITPANTNEGNAGTRALTFTITLSEAAGTSIPIAVSTTSTGGANGAILGEDYMAPGATASFPAGQTTGTVTVPIIGDQDVEANELFGLVLTPHNPRDDVDVDEVETTGTIVNDDQFLPSLTIANAQILEGNSGTSLLDFVITLSDPSAEQVSVLARVENGTATLANQDYADSTAVVIFEPGTTTAHFTVPVIGDGSVEPDETLTVTLSGPGNAKLGAETVATGTILNDDEPGSEVTVSIASASVSEGNGGLRTAVFAIDLSAPAPTQLSLTAMTVNGTALAGEDFQGKSSNIVIGAGQTHADFVVNLLPDLLIEGDETFSVVLSNPSGAITIANGTATGTIFNDDDGTPPTIDGLNIVDTAAAHAWWGDAAGDMLQGSGGNDSLMGIGGSDQLDGGDGNDLLMGGLGAGDGPDSLTGGAGNDTAMGGAGNDTIKGGTGNDLLMGDDGNDTILGGNDNDQLIGGAGDDYLWGEAGNDTIMGQGGADQMVGGSGQDQLIADGGADTLTGGSDADQLVYLGTGSDDIVITDFAIGVDLVLLDPRLGLTAAQADSQTVASGFDAVLSFAGGGSITFTGLAANLDALSAADFGVLA